MTDPLVVADDLTDFPGAPFADAVVLAAGEGIRGETGWHIAPSVTETLVVDSDGGRFLVLPTMYLTAVTAVRDVTNVPAGVVLTDWRVQKTLRFRAGVLDAPCGWPCGVVEVDVTHGYDECPADLLAAVASRCQSTGRDQAVTQEQETAGSESLSRSYATATIARDPVVSRYRLPGRP